MFLRIFTILILFLITMPILIMIPMSFSPSHTMQLPVGDFSMQWYENFVHSSGWTQSLIRSILVAFFVAILATVIGIMAALAVNRLSFPLKSLFMNLMVAPMVIPVIVVGIAL